MSHFVIPTEFLLAFNVVSAVGLYVFWPLINRRD